MKLLPQPRAFTLIEIMVSVSLFAIVVTVSLGALLTIIDTNRKAQTLQLVMNNLNFAIESMVREMREAIGFKVMTGGVLKITKGTVQNPIFVTFSAPNGVLTRTEGSATPESLTAEGIFIDKLIFQTTGDDPSRLLMIIRGYSTTTKTDVRTTFSIQTTVAQRNK